MREADRYDSGFVCKACGRFYADKDVKQWDTKWMEPAVDGERTLLQIIQECPLCGVTSGYTPDEATLRGVSQDEP